MKRKRIGAGQRGSSNPFLTAKDLLKQDSVSNKGTDGGGFYSSSSGGSGDASLAVTSSIRAKANAVAASLNSPTKAGRAMSKKQQKLAEAAKSSRNISQYFAKKQTTEESQKEVEEVEEVMTEEMMEEMTKEMAEEMTEDMAEEMAEEMTEEMVEEMAEDMEEVETPKGLDATLSHTLINSPVTVEAAEISCVESEGSKVIVIIDDDDEEKETHKAETLEQERVQDTLHYTPHSTTE